MSVAIIIYYVLAGRCRLFASSSTKALIRRLESVPADPMMDALAQRFKIFVHVVS